MRSADCDMGKSDGQGSNVTSLWPDAVVLLTGKRKSGKDYVAGLLERTLLNVGGCSVTCLRLSGPLKQDFADLHGLRFDELLTDSEYKEAYRKEMVCWGEQIRQLDPCYFCRRAVEQARRKEECTTEASVRFWIVVDCRRPTDFQYFEAASCENNFAMRRVRIEATATVRSSRGWKFVPGIDDQETECALDDFSSFDCIFVNNDCSISQQVHDFAVNLHAEMRDKF